ncbi:ubiquitin carboxyl-terminal hydrolase MINDY-3 homolog [Harpegnathos saltator]|uniref:Ubiquitin carboxyl-terminal hydrolase MINDY n=1 Tax=Harpegnathos saltator TaxID=610380 RepID=E2BWV3_HARSA|nr:ubiquitin carboxyl-terminal hydrolase MINDY-3 homolog [Harpegnathos saltator]EFN79817.1 Protein CARP-like protein [Harpegnathos saltator]
MAENVITSNDELLKNIKSLLWGSTVKEDVFKRWAQGFSFSADEPTALVQREGGPCAVIAPVQAFILKQLLLEGDVVTWKAIEAEKCDQLLVKAMIEIVNQASDIQDPKYSVVYTNHSNVFASSKEASDPKSAESMVNSVEDTSESSQTNKTQVTEQTLESEVFHSQLRIFTTNNIDDIEDYFTERIGMLKDQYGVLLLLYTVMCTKGISGICSEMSDPTEPMIDSTYGYGSQSLINLMLTGRAVSHVWDHDQDIGGLKLRGIDKQNTVGFLALLEHLRYCEVGTFLKSPSHSIWVLGSETHLTVLFSTEKRLVSPETPAEQARRIFKRFDPEGNNFISANLLQDVLAELGLVADAEYVDIMRKKLDNENLGIILLASFMDEFFPEERCMCPDTFVLYHYNGLQRSNPENRVKYHKGQAVLLECTVKCIMDSNPMLTVLQTKWPRIEIQWDIERNPSLN